MSVDETIDRNRRNRGVVRATVTNVIKSVEAELAKEVSDIEVLQDKLNILVKRETDLQTLDETINGQIKLVELEKEVEHELEYSDSIIRCKGRIRRFIDKHRCSNVDAAVITRQVNNTKLPRIVLDKFGGDIRKFHEFWPSFEAAVHDNPSLTRVEKFNYLRSLLIGDAARAISGLNLTNENYDKAVEVLKDRFGQKQAVISAYMNTLLSLQPVRRINDTLGLRNLYDEINNSIRSLESLGIDIDSYGNLLYPILDRCIPVELMLLFNRDQVVKGVKEPVVSDLINFLKGEMEARERSFSERTELIPIAKSNYPLFKKTQTASFNRGGSSAAALNVSIGKFCDFCPKETHRNEDCKLSMHDKYKALYDQYKCRRCLRKGHKKKFCNVKGIKCKTCGSQSHWEYLCDKGQKSNKNGIASVLRQKGFVLSDQGSEDTEIGLLIGNDLMDKILTGKTYRLSENLMLYETIFGWVINGSSRGESASNCTLSMCTRIECCEEERLSDLWYNWFQLESQGINDSLSGRSETDEKIIQKFEENLRFENGRYVTGLLWKREPVDLRDNFHLAKRQFDRFQGELKTNIFVRNQCEEIINFQKANNIVEECNENETGYFMPYRSVVRKDKSTTQVRLVFNCSSSKRGDLSLNDYLEQGPNLNPSLLDVLLKFRIFKVVFCGDIEKAFLMIGIAEDDRRYLRFLWNTNDKGKEYVALQMNRVLFGSRCSPFLLRATIRYHVRKYLERYPDCVDMLDNALYADDLCYGAETVQEALSLSAGAVSILKDAGFHLRKLCTNSRELQALWIQNGLSNEVGFEQDCKLKVLGLVWNLDEDCVGVDVTPLLNSLESMGNTKRSVLSTVARVFDPLGFISPFVVRVKKLVQEIWERGVDWDSKLPDDLRIKWEKWCCETGCLSDVRISRCYFSNWDGNAGGIEMHIFCDSSQVAYGAVAYFRWETTSGEVGVRFVMAKSRLAPLKKLSLPRLELMGALVGAKLWKHLSVVFKSLVKRVVMWTDSEICLHWIKSSAMEWKQFVSNRVVEIQDCVVPDRRFHCPGLENPADRLTRGVSAVSLKSNDLWWSAPRWLKSPRYDWPQQKFRVPDEYMQEKRIVVHTAIVKDDPLIDISRFSSLTRLLRVTAYVLRFLGKLGGKSTQTGPLVAAEISEAEEFWMKQVQREHFDFEIARLNRGQQIPAASRIWSLAPYLQEGHLCVKGRLEQIELTQEEKHPILLPRSKYTDLLILHEHNRGFHLGVIATLSRLRERFWIPKGRQSVKSVLKSCLVCRKYSAKPARQQTGQLPQDRVVACPPFTTVGTDFTRAITVKTTGGALQKVYIVLFTCAVTRAVHLEVVSNMSIKSFIMSLRRFLARRGCVKVFYSDNAKTYRSSCEILKGFKSIIRQPELKSFITSEGISWKFIPERSPWWGGFWERLMRSIREPLRKTLGRALLTLEELSTILTEIESVINNRPITYDSDELDEPRALTPSHFLLL
ncbi:hypothetical protein AVEN_154299-1 [Araneus ventricosus]|uniref:Integrase catalytic domain-containing protein n=1 Tax=Araneus ventricosus TaxID=182803 RepID=A0A4Y2U950_ARAVE|nr:hypothetical protein AVEN_264260-1 [Araneus ventricosus]GBO08580.1 hypothetical protein AVEN_95024-1 [Araneus ventricosus]GBO08581.1 hypothetical protein AVEN_154299-1 [Araneus ventricosus]